MNKIEDNLKAYKAKLSETEKLTNALLKHLTNAHESLVKLAQVDRDLKELKKDIIKDKQLTGELNDQYLDLMKVQTGQVNLPLLSIETGLSRIMNEVKRLNGPGSSQALDKLPKIFTHNDHMSIFTGREKLDE
jgi:seryl-tRNA synthetase